MIVKKTLRTDLEELPSMKPKIKRVLMDNGITDVEKLAATDLKTLIAYLRNSDVAILLTEEAEVVMEQSGFGFVSGEALLEQFESIETMTTGCKPLDAILHDGLETRRLYQFYGPNGVGKTNLLFQLICMARLPKKKGGLGASSIYLDAEGNFTPRNIRNIALRFGLDPSEVIKGIECCKIHHSDELKFVLDRQLFAAMEKTKARLIVLDSITTNARAEFIGESALWARQGLLGKISHTLKNASQVFNAIVVVANQVTGDPITKEYKPSGGNILGHETQVRVSMYKYEKFSDEVWFTMEKAVDLKQDSCVLKQTSSGFYDPELIGQVEQH